MCIGVHAATSCTFGASVVNAVGTTRPVLLRGSSTTEPTRPPREVIGTLASVHACNGPAPPSAGIMTSSAALLWTEPISMCEIFTLLCWEFFDLLLSCEMLVLDA